MNSLRLRASVYALIIVVGLLCALPNVLPTSMSHFLPGWYSNSRVALGLDLRGGSQLLLEMNGEKVLEADIRRLAEQVREHVQLHRFAATVRVEDQKIFVRPLHSQQLPELMLSVRQFVAPTDSFTDYTVTKAAGEAAITATDNHASRLQEDALERSLEIVRGRLNETGLVDPSVTRQGATGILVQLPGVEDPRYVRQLLGTTAQLNFHWLAEQGAPAMTLPGNSGHYYYDVEPKLALEGKHIRDASLGYSQETGQPVVNFRLDAEGARRFASMTQHHLGRPLAVVLDQKVLTAPVIRSVITGGSGEISGDFTSAEASDLALLLRAGALPAPLEIIEERVVGPDLGSDSIAMGVITGLLGTALVFVFMVAVYGRWGVIANASLAVNIVLIFGVLSVFNATLTLPGIAGLILSVGMAVDANILINERIREEIRRGKGAFGAMNAGFDRAYSTILDSSITTLIAICLLFLFGSGPVRGFALTMAVGLITSMFTAIAVTRCVMEWRVRRRGRAPLEIASPAGFNGLSGRAWDILRVRSIGVTLACALALGSLILLWQPGLTYGIDFTGGVLVEVKAIGHTTEELRAILKPHFNQVNIQEVAQALNGSNHYFIRLPYAENVEALSRVAELKTVILETVLDAQIVQTAVVGPKVSGEFAELTVLAVLFAGVGMLLYLWVRFEVQFALAAVATLLLDLAIVMGFFAVMGIEFNLTAVAALLALLGYSVNDKVVVFDRVREHLRKNPAAPLVDVLNGSISATLTRTLFTSVTTVLALLPMGIAGGGAVSSFALPMLFGIVVGTASSIFIAAPILLWLSQRRLRRGLPALRPTAQQLQQQLKLLP